MEEREIISVSQLNAWVKSLLEEEPAFHQIWVEGEISNYKQQSSGHLYFSLKDDQASVRCVMFSAKARLLRFRPDNSMKVLLRASVTLYERDGQYQLSISQMEPQGMGSLALALEQLKKRLTAEGLFGEESKKSLPFFPKTVGIVTSPSGAAVHDIISVITRRCPGVTLYLAPVLVQGPGAAEQIAAAIEMFNQHHLVEVLIVGRGGGSLEELWAFNEEVVVRAIYQSAIPVVSAIGHETDFTLSDFAADLRAPTPSAAAELVVPNLQMLKEQILGLNNRLNNSIDVIFKQKQERLFYYQNKLEPEIFRSWLQHKQNSLSVPKQRLLHLTTLLVQQRTGQWQNLCGKLEALSPLRILSRGYAFCQNEQTEEIITSITRLRLGDEINITFVDGKATGRILEIKEHENGGDQNA
jgi:exodeoxyribonuclease VII large subunit